MQTVCAFIRYVACVSDSKLRTLVGEALPDSGVDTLYCLHCWTVLQLCLVDVCLELVRETAAPVPKRGQRPTLVLDDGVSPASVHVGDSCHGGKDLGTYLRRRALRNVPQEPPLALCKRAID